MYADKQYTPHVNPAGSKYMKAVNKCVPQVQKFTWYTGMYTAVCCILPIDSPYTWVRVDSHIITDSTWQHLCDIPGIIPYTYLVIMVLGAGVCCGMCEESTQQNRHMAQ